ncbi:hypothetical protein ADILRU_0854 [Leifsonia rubra CMS 76R]|nr:hypothetical protein ADILRU_0854 [Leifsonia rubra CMS 76R]
MGDYAKVADKRRIGQGRLKSVRGARRHPPNSPTRPTVLRAPH